MSFVNCSLFRAWCRICLRHLLISSMAMLLFFELATADQVRHLFDQDTGSFSLQTNGACGALLLHRDSVRCNPALLRRAGQSLAVVELTALSDEPTFRALLQIASKSLSASDVQRIFARNNFAYFSGYARFATSSKWFSIEYTPLALSGAYSISNPSLPYVQVSGVQKSSYAALSSIDTTDFFGDLPFYLAIGAKVFFDSGVHASVDLDAASALAADRKNVVNKDRLDEFDANFGAYLSFAQPIIPKLGLVCENCIGGESRTDEPGKLQADLLEERLVSTHLSWDVSPGIGSLWVSGALFWADFFNQLESSRTAASLGYRVGEFTASISYSPARFGWGFVAQRGYYHIGMQYAFEKQPPLFQIERQQKLYLSIGAAL